MGRYHTSRADGNAQRLYDVFEAHGFTVLKIGYPMDALILNGRRMALVDPKGSARTPVRPRQAALVKQFPDLCFLLYDETDAVEVLRRMRGC